jgi:hypothetical protein
MVVAIAGPSLAEWVRDWLAREERRKNCGTEGFPHEFVDRVIGPFSSKFVEQNRDVLEEMTTGMSPFVCRICRKPKT